jgi:hypothetical protein
MRPAGLAACGGVAAAWLRRGCGGVRWRGGVVAWWRGGVVAWWRGGVVASWRGGVVARRGGGPNRDGGGSSPSAGAIDGG